MQHFDLILTVCLLIHVFAVAHLAEKALKKKQIGIKMAPRDSATDAVVDIFLQNKSKRPPDGCTVAGYKLLLSACY